MIVFTLTRFFSVVVELPQKRGDYEHDKKLQSNSDGDVVCPLHPVTQSFGPCAE
jgi:hypothetical protein